MELELSYIPGKGYTLDSLNNAEVFSYNDKVTAYQQACDELDKIVTDLAEKFGNQELGVIYGAQQESF